MPIKYYTTEIKGKNSTWIVELSQRQAVAMEEDGIEIQTVFNTAPDWVVELGLMKVWFFIQDIFYFQNPFSKD